MALLTGLAAGVPTSAASTQPHSRLVSVSCTPQGTLNTFLNGVSCGGPSLCFAVGDQNDNTDLTPGVLLEKWNGTDWAVQPPLPEPAGAAGIGIQAVSCVSPSDCTAVGVAALNNFTQQTTLAEHWDGHG